MSFSQPYYLYALLGLIVPIVIHLWNREQGKLIKVGSIKLLVESDTNRMNSIKMNEWLLLLLRMTLIALLVMILIGLILSSDKSKSQTMLRLIDPEYIEHKDIRVMLDTTGDDNEIRLFNYGFTSIDEWKSTTSSIDYWSLLRSLHSTEYDSIVVYSPMRLSNFRGTLSGVPSNVSIVGLPEEKSNDFIEKVSLKGSDSLMIITGSNQNNQLTYSKSTIQVADVYSKFNINVMDSIVIDSGGDTVKIEQINMLRIGLKTDEGYADDSRFIVAAFETLTEYDVASFDLMKFTQGESYDLIIWLSMEEFNNDNLNQLTLEMSPQSNPESLIQKIDECNYHLTNRTTPKELEEELLLAFPQSIYSFLLKTNLINNQESRYDLRSISPYEISSVVDHSPHEEIKQKNIYSEVPDHTWIWLFFLLVFALERFLSINKARQV